MLELHLGIPKLGTPLKFDHVYIEEEDFQSLVKEGLKHYEIVSSLFLNNLLVLLKT